MMGKVIVIQPGHPAILFDHAGSVQLDDLYRHIGCRYVSAKSLGPNPASGRNVDAWFDDEGLLNDSVPNRKIGPEAIICGTILLCAQEEADSVPFTDDEAEAVRAHVEKWWAILPPDFPKPEARFEVIELG